MANQKNVFTPFMESESMRFNFMRINCLVLVNLTIFNSIFVNECISEINGKLFKKNSIKIRRHYSEKSIGKMKIDVFVPFKLT